MQQRAREQEHINEIARAFNTLDMAFPVLVQGMFALAECEPVVLALRDESHHILTVAESTLMTLPVGSTLTLPPEAQANGGGMRPHLRVVSGEEQDELLLAELHALGVRSRVLKDHPYNRRLAEGEVVIIEDVQQHDMGWVPSSAGLHPGSSGAFCAR